MRIVCDLWRPMASAIALYETFKVSLSILTIIALAATCFARRERENMLSSSTSYILDITSIAIRNAFRFKSLFLYVGNIERVPPG
jgi:hypothetical protein